MSQDSAAERGTIREVLAIPEFRALYVAQSLSVMGDQLSRIAIAMLVYDRTRSPLATEGRTAHS